MLLLFPNIKKSLQNIKYNNVAQIKHSFCVLFVRFYIFENLVFAAKKSNYIKKYNIFADI